MKWLNRPLLVPCLLCGCKHFLSSGWCGFLIGFGWSAKGRRHSSSTTEHLFHMSHAKRKATSFWSYIRTNSPLANSNELTVLWEFFSLHVYLLQEKSPKLVRALTSNLMEFAAKAWNEKTVNAVIFSEVLKLCLRVFNILKLFASIKQLCIPLAPCTTRSNLSSCPF